MNNELDLNKQNEFLKSIRLDKPKHDIFHADNIIVFDVSWKDSQGISHINKGYRVQWNNLNGPYKGGLRFHPSVNLELFKQLAFEQTFKNILTTLPMGGAKGGSDFDPHGKSEEDIKLFCEAFMEKLVPYIGVEKDIPAGDIGVGGKEVEYLYSKYVSLTGKHDCALTGKPLSLGGSLVRKEATGYGLCYITNKMLQEDLKTSFKDKTVIISGSGNVAIYAAEKAIQLGAKVLAMSDSNTAVYVKDGINLDIIKEIKEVKKARISTYVDYDSSAWVIKTNDIYKIKADIVLPCATQNELDLYNAEDIVRNGALCVCEGANMPCTLEAKEYFLKHNVLFLPGKASNAGGVTVSGLEIIQNNNNEHWSFEKVDAKLKKIMETIFINISNTAKNDGYNHDYIYGANKYSYNKLMELYHGQTTNK